MILSNLIGIARIARGRPLPTKDDPLARRVIEPEVQELAHALCELCEQVFGLKFPGDNRPLFEDGGPDPIGVSLEPLATAGFTTASPISARYDAQADPILTNDGKLDISATPHGESFVASMRRGLEESRKAARRALDMIDPEAALKHCEEVFGPERPKHMTTQAIHDELNDIYADCQEGGSWSGHSSRHGLLIEELRLRDKAREDARERRMNDFRATPARTRAPLRDELVAIIGGYGFDPNERNAKLLRDMVDRILDRLIRNSDDRRSDDFLRAVRDGDV